MLFDIQSSQGFNMKKLFNNLWKSTPPSSFSSIEKQYPDILTNNSLTIEGLRGKPYAIVHMKQSSTTKWVSNPHTSCMGSFERTTHIDPTKPARNKTCSHWHVVYKDEKGILHDRGVDKETTKPQHDNLRFFSYNNSPSICNSRSDIMPSPTIEAIVKKVEDNTSLQYNSYSNNSKTFAKNVAKEWKCSTACYNQEHAAIFNFKIRHNRLVDARTKKPFTGILELRTHVEDQNSLQLKGFLYKGRLHGEVFENTANGQKYNIYFKGKLVEFGTKL